MPGLPDNPPPLVGLGQVSFVGGGLQRPECVLCTADGSLHVSDWRGGVTRIDASGAQTAVLGAGPGVPLRPNGICLLPDGSYLLAQLGDDDGGVYRLAPDGSVEPYALTANAAPLPPTNYVHRDADGRVWVTVSTRRRPRALGYRPGDGDGFIALVADGSARIVADGLGYTNECLVHPDGLRLFVNETFARRLTVFDVRDDGDLGNRRTLTEFGPGTFPDGLALDAEDGVWVTSIVSNRIIRVAPDGSQQLILEDCDAQHLDRVERDFQAGRMTREHLDSVKSRMLGNVSSLGFGGKGCATVYLGCLAGDAIATFASPIPGHPPVHWEYPIR